MKQNVKSSVFPSQTFLCCCKLLGMTINNKLTWNSHIDEVVKKVSKRIYYLIQLKRANIPLKDLVLFYVTCIRSVIDYGIPVISSYVLSELE